MLPVPNSVPSVEKSINLFIDHQCPQCGAPAVLRETDRLFRCDYCRVSAYLAEDRFFRYLLPHKAPEGTDLIYFPYWRFKGMLFSCLPSGIQDRFLDLSQQAVPSPHFPVSLGLRSQAMRLRFVSPDTQGWFINPSLPFHRVMETFLARTNTRLPAPLFHQAAIGESLSLIYAPFYLGSRIMDAVLNQPVTETAGTTFSIEDFSGGAADYRIRFIPSLCPDCGWDLSGCRDAEVLHCHNCSALWQASKNGMQRVKAAHLPAPGDTDTCYLPFWRIAADVSGAVLNSYADLITLANLPKVIQPQWHKVPHYFWSPAFKLRPRSFLRLTRHLTLAQPRDGLEGSVPDGTLHPVNLPVSECVEMLKLNLIDLMRSKKEIASRINDLTVTPRRHLLVYLPFDVSHHDLVQTTFNIAVNRNQLALSTNL